MPQARAHCSRRRTGLGLHRGGLDLPIVLVIQQRMYTVQCVLYYQNVLFISLLYSSKYLIYFQKCPYPLYTFRIDGGS